MLSRRHLAVAIGVTLSIGVPLAAWHGAEAQQSAPAYGAIRPAAAPVPPPAPASAAKSAPAPAAKSVTKPDIANCHPANFRVVIDVGHTARVPGAMSARGVSEYSFNLALARDTKQALVDAGFTGAVLLVTDKAPPRGLFARAAQANSQHADLFLSIHHDSVPDNLLQTWQYEGQEQHFNDNYPGYALFVSEDNADITGSLMFARLLGKELKARGLQYTPHYTLALMGHRRRELLDPIAGVYRYDQLIVLRTTHMPAVLLEAGSIVNRAEELDLETSERRTRTGAAIVAAVQEFCAARARPAIIKANAPSRANVLRASASPQAR
jgi:N-acetylmuramoyl-L-alanine amidase